MADEKIPDEQEQRSAAARLFDIRRVIGLLFVVYGVIVTLMDGDAVTCTFCSEARASGPKPPVRLAAVICVRAPLRTKNASRSGLA